MFTEGIRSYMKVYEKEAFFFCFHFHFLFHCNSDSFEIILSYLTPLNWTEMSILLLIVTRESRARWNKSDFHWFLEWVTLDKLSSTTHI